MLTMISSGKWSCTLRIGQLCFARLTCVACASYNIALDNVKRARAKLDTLGEPHQRPDDYFAEMLKTDTHMQRVRSAVKSSFSHSCGQGFLCRCLCRCRCCCLCLVTCVTSSTSNVACCMVIVCAIGCAIQVKDKLIFEQKKMAAVEQRKREKEQRQCVIVGMLSCCVVSGLC